ncbi:hypothetical protein B0J12DRAFT_420257 [Macrophomina phaseolina]|uniref:Uncharacterized protein n=1 Tax=Macrophomina phaseolina TaxID=35725 RepID=A0ABQ8FR78_9PEZI|nr:hypothetical protein B0J12DRAFT_420257 [Macrophomina phaseolina]
MKLALFSSGILAATSALAADPTIRVGCRPHPDHPGLSMNQVVSWVSNPTLRGSQPDLRYGFWDGKVQNCCLTQIKTCSSVFTFSYNHPFAWANYAFETAKGNGKWIQCFHIKPTDMTCS